MPDEHSAFKVMIALASTEEPEGEPVPLGSGVVIGERRVLTAWHVIKDRPGDMLGVRVDGVGPLIPLEGEPHYSADEDVAVLVLDRSLGVRPASLAGRAIRREPYFCWGYPVVNEGLTSSTWEQWGGAALPVAVNAPRVNLDADNPPPDWRGASGAAVVATDWRVLAILKSYRSDWSEEHRGESGEVVARGRSFRQVATPAGRFINEQWFLDAMGEDTGDWATERARVQAELRALLTGEEAICELLAEELQATDSKPDSVAQALMTSSAQDVALALQETVVALQQPSPDAQRAGQKVRRLLVLVLPYAIDWEQTTAPARRGHLAGSNRFELHYRLESLAEATMAAAEGRPCAFRRAASVKASDGGAPRADSRLTGAGFLSMPSATKASLRPEAKLVRDAVVQKLAHMLGVPDISKLATDRSELLKALAHRTGASDGSVADMISDINGRMAARALSRRRKDPRVCLLVLDEAFIHDGKRGGGEAWELVCDNVGALLPHLRLVRLRGDREQLERDALISALVEYVIDNTEPE